MDALTLDQFTVFVTVVDEGSFSGAARRLNRAQSAITYAVRKLEDQLGLALFDRSTYRPGLSAAGRALLPRARRIVQDVAELRMQAHGIAGGLEPELSLVADSMFPMPCLVQALAAFQREFPTVQTRIYVESLGATVQVVQRGEADLGVVLDFANQLGELHTTPAREIELVAVVAAGHSLAALDGPIPSDAFLDQVQLVLTDRSGLTEGRDYGVLSVKTVRLADLGAKHALLLAGLGWGSMPRHMVAADLAEGRLVQLHPAAWDDGQGAPRLAAVVVRRPDKVLGPAGRWMAARLAQRGETG